MIENGKTVKLDSGRHIRVDGLINAGGQGTAYGTTEKDTSLKGVLKVFHKQFVNGHTMERLRFLVDQDLASACPVLCAPIDVLNQRDMVGHYTPYAPGQSLEKFLANPNGTVVDGLQLAITMAHAVDEMHKRQIAHGDLHAENLIINHVGSVIQLYLIDLDNFYAPGVSNPSMAGHNLYLAPELREALSKAQPAIPNLYSDRFALGVLMHEIILLRHVAAGSDENEAAFLKAMCSGIWRQDPAAADKPLGNLGGYPTEVLNADLARLFRSALSRDPAERPCPKEWVTALSQAIQSVYICPRCSGPFIIDAAKVSCPICKEHIPALRLVTGNGKSIDLDKGAVLVGRDILGGSPKVSSRHAVFRRIGPETWIESVGRNGIYRKAGSKWIKLPDNHPILIQKGDVLQIGDVQTMVA